MASLFEFEVGWPFILDGVAKPVQRTHPRITPPRECELANTAGADELIVYDIRRHTYQGQLAPLLPDDLVTGGKRNEVGEAFKCEEVSILYKFGNRLLEA